MRVDPLLAEMIARQALSEPYRQTACMTTRKWEQWLATRGLRLKWETMHHLWAIGLVRPIAIQSDALALTPNLSTKGRFTDIRLEPDDSIVIDLGVDASKVNLTPPPDELPFELRESLIWHPFQLWQFERLLESLQVRIAGDAVVQGHDAFMSIADFAVTWVRDRLVVDIEDNLQSSSLRALALLLTVDPLVHIDVYGRHTFDFFKGGTGEGYQSWIHAQDGEALLTKASMTIEEAVQWHERLSWRGQAHDSFGPFRRLIRSSNRNERSRLRNAALLSQDFYDLAEVLRRYLERYHGQELPNELDVGRRVRNTPRRQDELRALTRRLGVDPQERVHWFVEGQTEEAFIYAWATGLGIDLRRAGIVVRNVEGVGFFKTSQFREQLHYCRQEKIFAYVSVDQDPETVAPDGGTVGGRVAKPAHVRELDHYERQRQLPIGFTVWDSDFVTANFTLDELAEIATNAATDEGAAITITAADIAAAVQFYPGAGPRPKPLRLEQAIASLWRDKAGLHHLSKGFKWGEVLAKWAIDNPQIDGPHPDHFVLNKDTRPITKLVLMLMRGKRSNYDLSAEMHARDTEVLKHE